MKLSLNLFRRSSVSSEREHTAVMPSAYVLTYLGQICEKMEDPQWKEQWRMGKSPDYWYTFTKPGEMSNIELLQMQDLLMQAGWIFPFIRNTFKTGTTDPVVEVVIHSTEHAVRARRVALCGFI